MAGLGDSLITALQGVQTTPKDTGYGLAAQSIASLAPSLINPYGSTGSNIGLAAGSTLLAALLGGFAKDEANQENIALHPLISDYLSGDKDKQTNLLVDNPELAKLDPYLAAAAQSKQEESDKADLEVKKAIDIAKGTLPYDIQKLQEGSRIRQEAADNKPIPSTGVDKITTGVTISKQLQKAIDLTKEFSQTGAGLPLIGGLVNKTIGAAGREFNSLDNTTAEGKYGQLIKLIQEQAGKSISGSARWPIVKANLDEVAAGRIGTPEGTAALLQQTKDLIDGETQDQADKYGDAGYKKLGDVLNRALIQDTGIGGSDIPGAFTPQIQTRQLKDGTSVTVQSRPDGSWQEVTGSSISGVTPRG